MKGWLAAITALVLIFLALAWVVESQALGHAGKSAREHRLEQQLRTVVRQRNHWRRVAARHELSLRYCLTGEGYQ